MMNKHTRTFAVTALSVLAGGVIWAQGRNIGPEWQAAGADPQRTYWQKYDPNINVDSVSKPGFELQWTTKLDNRARSTQAISEAVTVNGIGLFWPVSLVTGSSNAVFEIDNDTGNVQWMRRFEGALPATSTAACPGGIAAAPARVYAPPPPPQPGAPRAGGGGRGAGYRGAVGEPGQGLPPEFQSRGGGRGAAGAPGAAGPAALPAGAPPGARGAEAGAPEAARGVVPPGVPGVPGAPGAPGAPGGPGGPGGRPGGGGGGLGRVAGPGYVIAADGVLHTLGWQEGKEIEKPVPFLPANARASSPILVENVMYTSTSGNCGGAPDGVWAIDLSNAAKPVTSFKTSGKPMGSVALTTDGRPVVSIGKGTAAATPGSANAIVVLEPKTLSVKDWFSDPANEPASQPTIFKLGGKEIIAVSTTNGRVLLLDAAAPGGANHSTPLFASEPIAPSGPDALTTWQEMDRQTGTVGTRWLLTSTANAIVALKVVDAAGKPTLQTGWTSRAMPSPVTPVIVNGVVFAAASGRPSGTATLYALDGVTGKELWNSGKTITSSLPSRSMWGANSQIHTAAFDGTVYAFGFALERK